MIVVVAPADLAPGYQFEAEANGKSYMITVVSFESSINNNQLIV
jgi:hypothetical protein